MGGKHARHSIFPSNSGEAVESLTEKLRNSEAKVRKLDAKVRELQALVNTRPLPAHQPSSSQPSLQPSLQLSLQSSFNPSFTQPLSTSHQKPSGHTFTIETPQHGQRTTRKTAQKSNVLQSLLALAPSTNQEWCERRKDILGSEPGAVIRTFWEFINYARSVIGPQGHAVEILEHFESFVGKPRKSNLRATQLINFGTLLLICYFRVARIAKVLSLDEVDKRMNGFLPEKRNAKTIADPDRQASHLKQLRTAVLWPIRQANQLRVKVRHRADEFFLLYGPGIETYRALWTTNGTEKFADLVDLPSPPVEGEANGNISFSVPFMLKMIAGDSLSLTQINKGLKTDLSQEQFEILREAVSSSVQPVWDIKHPPTKKRKTGPKALDEGQERARGSTPPQARQTGLVRQDDSSPTERALEQRPPTLRDACLPETVSPYTVFQAEVCEEKDTLMAGTPSDVPSRQSIQGTGCIEDPIPARQSGRSLTRPQPSSLTRLEEAKIITDPNNCTDMPTLARSEQRVWLANRNRASVQLQVSSPEEVRTVNSSLGIARPAFQSESRGLIRPHETQASTTQPIQRRPSHIGHHISGQGTVPSPTLAQASTSLAEPSFVDKTHMLLRSPSSIIRPSIRTSLVNPQCVRAAPIVRGFFSDPHSPSPPQALLVSENLLRNITLYFENSCRNMHFSEHGTLLTPNGAKLDNALCNDFDSYCFTATMLIKKGLYKEFRCTLSKASALVEDILRAEHPRTIACFLEVFIHLIQTGLPEVVSALRGYIKSMSEKVTRKGHPWGNICGLLGELDSESLDQAMARVWEITTDIFDRELGKLNRLAVSVRLDYIKRVVTDHPKEERLLRDLLASLGGIPQLPTPRVMLNLAHNLHKQGRYDEAEEMALKVRSLLQEQNMYADRIAERIESLKIVSRCQFKQGKALEAEQTMRDAIQKIEKELGIQHSWALEFMNVLEGWFRGWGREEDANALRRKIEELIGKGEIDEGA